MVGLAFAGLSSGTLKWMSDLSTIGTTVVMLGMALGILYLGGQTPIDPRSMSVSIVVTVVSVVTGIWYFRRVERGFADVI